MRSTRRSKNILDMRSGSEHEIGAMNSLIQKGPLTIMLVYTETCPHCISYMPIWKKLCATPGRNANMIRMEASTYQKTPMFAKKQIQGVPTILRVDESGEITEIMEPRNIPKMTETIRESTSSERKNPLHPIPGIIQQGGSSPWTAYLRARTQRRNRRRRNLI
jgi:thiol-disulfide isomerase/thioredoxin